MWCCSGTTSRTGSYVKQLAARLQDELKSYPNIDGIVPAAHTEGGAETPNNLELLLRTLAGFIVNPNVGAVLVVDDGDRAGDQRGWCDAICASTAIRSTTCCTASSRCKAASRTNLAAGEAIVARVAAGGQRDGSGRPNPISHLKIGLQCGGSDAFSGISANPLLGWIARELVRYGGAANLAETDELIGAEPYVLQKVRDVETARKFLALDGAIQGARVLARRHRGGQSVRRQQVPRPVQHRPQVDRRGPQEGPRHPPRLCHRLRRARCASRGYYFMDSPGNDLESIAGQVASGCNMIFFMTGNGSITNFPFVPTIKVVTTTQPLPAAVQRYGRQRRRNTWTARPWTSSAERSFDLTVADRLRAAQRRRESGSCPGADLAQLAADRREPAGALAAMPPTPTGEPIAIQADARAAAGPIRFTVIRHRDGHGQRPDRPDPADQPMRRAGRQYDRAAAQQARRSGSPSSRASWRWPIPKAAAIRAAKPKQLYARTMIGYVTHPMVDIACCWSTAARRRTTITCGTRWKRWASTRAGLVLPAFSLTAGSTKVTRQGGSVVRRPSGRRTSAAEKETVGLEATARRHHERRADSGRSRRSSWRS